MATIPVPPSRVQILGQQIDAFTSRTGIRRLKVGGPILSALEASSQADARAAQLVFQASQADSLDDATGAALDKAGKSEDVPRRLQAKATGTVNIVDTSFTKQASKIYQGTPAPIVGSTAVNVEKGLSFDAAPSTGQIYLGRGTSALEGPISYTAKTDNGAYWTLALSSPTTIFHNKGESVVRAQGGNRVLNAGSIVTTPQGALSSAVQFAVTFQVTIPDGETELDAVAVTATVPGAAGNVPSGAVTSFSGALPFPGATVFNPAPFVNGRDTDTDDTYRERIRTARQVKQGSTDLALEAAVLGAVAPDENKTVSSSRLIRRAGRPASLIIDDGTGYEETSSGVGLEVVVDAAIGGETRLATLQAPVTKAFVRSTLQAPFALEAAQGLTFSVGGVATTHNFDAASFHSIESASGYEVVASINGNPTLLWEARTADSGATVVIQARAETDEDIVLVPGTADAAFLFSQARRYTSLLYRNDVLLSKDGKSAVLLGNPFALWGALLGTQTLILAVDGTPALTYSFVDQDFVDAMTGYGAVGRNSLAAWVAVINAKIPGITASIQGDVVVLISNRGPSSTAKVDIQGGSLVSNGVFPILAVQGANADYSLDRATGQIALTTTLAPGDRLTLGSEWTRGFLETPALAPTTVATDLTTWWAVDAAPAIIPTGVGAATPLGAEVIQITDGGAIFSVGALTAVFSRVIKGDIALFWEPDSALPAVLRRPYRVIDVPDGTYMTFEKRVMGAARTGFGVVATATDAYAIGGYTQLGRRTDAPTLRLEQGITSTGEFYDHTSGAWSPIAAMNTARARHTATLLNDGRIFVAGGIGLTGFLASTEVYDPIADTWTPGPALAGPRAYHTATLLPSGRVLIAGGDDGISAQNSSQEYDPGTNTFIHSATLTTARSKHQALLLPGTAAANANNVVITGGFSGAKTATVEVYDTSAFSWGALASMHEARADHGFEVVGNDKLIVVGDSEDPALGGATHTYSLYTPSTDTWASSTALPSNFYFQNKRLVRDAAHNKIFALYGLHINAGVPECRHAYFDTGGLTWTLTTSSLFQNCGVEKVEVGFASITSGILAFGGVNRQAWDPTLPNLGPATASHELLNGGTLAWTVPDPVDALNSTSLPNRGLTVVRTSSYLQEAVVAAAANYTAPTFAAALNAALEGASAAVYRTSQLRVSTNAASTGDIMLVAATGNDLPLPIGRVATDLTPHFAVVSSASNGTPEGFQVYPVLESPAIDADDASEVRLGASVTPSSGSSLKALRRWDSGLNPNYWTYGSGGDRRISDLGSAAGFVAAVGSFAIQGDDDSYVVGLRRAPPGPLAPRQPVVLESAYALGPNDSFTVVVDGDTASGRFAIPSGRVVSTSGSYGQTITLTDGAATLAASFGVDYSFDDFAVYMAARGQTHLSDASLRVLWRYYRQGPEGNNVVVRYVYAAAPNASPQLVVSVGQGDAIDGYGTLRTANADILLGSGSAKTASTIRVDSHFGVARCNEASGVADVYALTGFQVVSAVRGSIGGMTKLTLQVPNNGVIATGPQSTGLVAGKVLWYEAAVPSSTTLLSGAFAIDHVDAFNAGTGQQAVYVPAATLDDGTATYSSGANPGTVSFSGDGEVVFDPSVATNDLFRINDATTYGAYGDTTMRVQAHSRQCLILRGVDRFLIGAQTTPQWFLVTDASIFSLFGSPTQTATQVVAAINSGGGAISGTVVGTGTGILSRASWDDANSAAAGTQLADGVNYVQHTIAPGSPSAQTQFLLRDAITGTLTSNSDWTSEQPTLVPVTVDVVVRWLLTPAVSGLFTAAEVVNADGAIQIRSLSAGSAGSIEVQGGTANAYTAVVRGAGELLDRIGATPSMAVVVPSADGFVGSRYVRIDNESGAPKTPFWDSVTNVTSVGASGLWSFDVAPWTVQFTVAPAKLIVEKVGAFVAVHYPYSLNATYLNTTAAAEGDYLYLHSRPAQTSDLPDLTLPNQGTYRIIRLTRSDDGATFWIENPNAVEGAYEGALKTLSADSVVPTDSWEVSTARFGAQNRGIWEIAEVGATTLGAEQYVSNCFRVTSRPQVVSAPIAIDTAETQLLVRAQPRRLYKQILSVIPYSGATKVELDGAPGYEDVGAAYGSVITALDKLSYPSGIFVGADGYAYGTGLVGEATRILYGDPSDTATYPGVVSNGATVLAQGPKVKRAAVALSLRVRSGAATDDLADAVRNAVAVVINQSAVGTPVPLSAIVAAASAVQGVIAVTVVSPFYTSVTDQIPVALDEKLLVLDLRGDITISFVGL